MKDSKEINLEASHEKLSNTIDRFLKRCEGEQIARDKRYERLLEWARKVSAKTGIPLENL